MGVLTTLIGPIRQRIRLRRVESRRRCRGIVLMFHEVLADDGSYQREFRHGCTRSFLDSMIAHLRRQRWDIVAPDDALRRMGGEDSLRRFAVLTFDDGYRDTLTQALPVLERHGAPFTVYIPTDAVTRALNSWWLGLRALFRSRDEFTISAMETTFACRDADSKSAAHKTVNQWVHQDYSRISRLDETFRKYGISLRDLNVAYFMDEAELRTLARSPLVTIGGHTTSHPPLSYLDADSARREMTDNRLYLEGLLDRPVPHFAYPYGGARACGPREIGLAAATGFRSGVVATGGAVFSAHCRRPHEIPRVWMGGTAADVAYHSRVIRDLGFAVMDETLAAIRA